MSVQHTLVVVGDIDEHGTDRRKFHIEHHGPVVSCVMWDFCPDGMPCHTTRVPRTEADVFMCHGVEHRGFEEGWAVRSDPPVCIYTTAMVDPQLPDVASYLTVRDPNGSLNEVPLFEGRYAVQPTWLGDGEFDLTIVVAGQTGA